MIPEKAYFLTVEGEVKEIVSGNSTDFTLAEAQSYVGGYIEVVNLTDDQIMIVNEEGKFMARFNPIATAIAELHCAISKHDYIAGDAVVCPYDMLR